MKVEKNLKLVEIINICEWYKNFKEKAKVLPIRDQWNLLSNIKVIQSDVDNFFNFKNDMEESIRDDFFNSDKSYDTQQAMVDEKGNPILDADGNITMQNIRKIKDEYIKDYDDVCNKSNLEINHLLSQESTYCFRPIDMESLVDKLENIDTIDINDLDMISFCMAEVE